MYFKENHKAHTIYMQKALSWPYSVHITWPGWTDAEF